MNTDKEKVELTHDELMDLWNGVYFKDSIYELNGISYKQVDIINTSEKSDGDSWDYIVERQSDGKFFKFNVWDAGERNGYIFEEKFLIEVFKTTKSKDFYE